MYKPLKRKTFRKKKENSGFLFVLVFETKMLRNRNKKTNQANKGLIYVYLESFN